MSQNIPEKFPFPYEQPYSIQTDFMKKLYDTISQKKIGLFESPTGTGKTLSIICGAFKWLEDHKENYIEEEEELQKDKNEKEEFPKQEKSDLPAWVTKQFKNQKIISKVQKQKEHFQKLENYESELDLLRLTKKRKYAELSIQSTNKSDNFNKPEQPPDRLKIIFASRTHSQLSQFVSELKKSPYGGKIAVVTLASRNSLCINESVRKLGSSAAINEACLELKNAGTSNDLEDDNDSSQQIEIETIPIKEPSKKKIRKSKASSSNKQQGCPYHKLTKELNLRNEIMSKRITDLEDLISQGKHIYKACPYYTARRSISNAELILVPYNILLNENLREKSGLVLKNNILIIDEAHNLTEAVNAIHSIEVEINNIIGATNQLDSYIFRYEKRLNESNLKFIKQLHELLIEIEKFLTSTSTGNTMIKPAEFIFLAKISEFDIKLILKWCESTSIARKLIGTSTAEREAEKVSAVKFITKDKENIDPKSSKSNSKAQNTQNKEEITSRHCLFKVLSFLEKIYSETSNDARITISKPTDGNQILLKYLLLNASNVFKTVLNQPRSVVIAGGTMKPFDSFKLQLMPGVEEKRIGYGWGVFLQGSLKI